MTNLTGIAEIKVSYSTNVPKEARLKTNGPYDSFKILYQSWDKDNIELFETVKVMLLNRANQVLGIYTVATGGTSGCHVDAKMVFSVALATAASAVVVCHNHPSGSTRPSQADINITKKLVEGGRLLDIDVLDHLIIAPDGNFYSFAEEGLIPPKS